MESTLFFPCHDLIIISTSSWSLFSTYKVVQLPNILKDSYMLTLLLEWKTPASYIVLPSQCGLPFGAMHCCNIHQQTSMPKKTAAEIGCDFLDQHTITNFAFSICDCNFWNLGACTILLERYSQDLTNGILQAPKFLEFQLLNQKIFLQSFCDCRSGQSKKLVAVLFGIVSYQ